MLAEHQQNTDPAPLLEKLRQRIAEHGPLTIAEYMEACLGDAEHGYYMTRDPLGAAGDFTTSPEISQMFGELIGAWCAIIWQQMGQPHPVRLIELGPGRGTLMADALRAAAKAPKFMSALDVHMVETSPVLRKVQAATLKNSDKEISWHNRLEDVPEGAAIVIANEFLDALPVRQFKKTGQEWHERCVELASDNTLRLGLIDEPLKDVSIIPDEIAEAADGSLAEVRPGVESLTKNIGSRAGHGTQTALFIDYGHERSAPGETLQAVQDHDYTDPLGEPGLTDLTAHVDFHALGKTATRHGLTAHGPMSQGNFLLSLGLKERCGALMAQADDAQRESLELAARRLAEPSQMGELFKVMVLTSAPLTPPPFPETGGKEPRP